ncbi:hypothetical protein J4410_05425 [Candidatus Woesearchaeota archaeon]|nr:hypothetical protein [Candidatus Woesearchaeota archaeon]
MSVSEGVRHIQLNYEHLLRNGLGTFIALPGQFAAKDGDAVQKTREALAESNIGFLYLNHGEEQNVITYPLINRVDDLVYAMQQLREQTPDLPFGVLGSSLGSVVMLAAAQKYLVQQEGNGNLAALIGKSPVPGSEALAQNPDFPTNSFLAGHTEQVTTDYFRSVIETARQRGIYVGAAIGDADKCIPVARTIGLFSPDTLIVPGADHPFTNPDHFKTMLTWVVGRAYAALSRDQR